MIEGIVHDWMSLTLIGKIFLSIGTGLIIGIVLIGDG